MDDRALMEGARGGDAWVFEQLVRAHQHALVRFATRLLDDPDAAQDAAQEAFLRLWRTRTRYECRGGDLRALLLRIVRNVCLDWVRARRPTDLLTEASDAAVVVEEATQSRVLADAVRRAVLDLPEAQRAVFVLSGYEGLSYAEIAQTLDCPLGTVASRKRLATQTLRRVLRPWMDEGDEE